MSRAPLVVPALLLAALLPPALLSSGCATTDDTRGPPVEVPWSESGAPTDLQALATDLLAFQGAAGKMPESLDALDRAGLSTAGPYGPRGFAYSSTGLGVLNAGWRLIVVDDRLREKGKVWCVARPPVRRTNDPALRVVLVPLGELHAAAVGASMAREPQ